MKLVATDQLPYDTIIKPNLAEAGLSLTSPKETKINKDSYIVYIIE